MNELNVFHGFVEVELTKTGLKILNEIDEKEKAIWQKLPDDSIVFFKNRIYDNNKLKTTIQELMSLFGKDEYCRFCNEFPFNSDIKIL